MNNWGVRLRETVFRGAQWLEQRANPDGSFRGCERDLAGYYKSLLAFAVCGRIERGARALAYLRVHLRGPEGEFASGLTKTSLERMQRNLANYMDGWIAIGAWLLSDYELSDDACRRLIAQQSQTHGGILTGPEKWVGRPRYDLSTAASCGRAFLIAGHGAAAVAAADFIAEALAHQTDHERGLDLCYDDHWRPLGAPDPAERGYYRFDLSRRGEKVWFPAFCSAFLCEVYQVTRESRYLAAAEDYYTFIARCPEFRNGAIANGKSGWASGLLARATGKVEYVAALARIVPNVLARQRENGEFGESPTAAGVGGPGVAAVAHGSADKGETPSALARRLERTAEFTVWSAEFLRLQALGLPTAGGGGSNG